MAFCAKCGTELAEEARFCPHCGQERGTPVTTEWEQDAKENKVFGILAYFGILVLIPIFAAPKTSRYSRFHANQGLVLWICTLILEVVDGVFELFDHLLGVLDFVGGILIGIGGIAMLVWAIMGIVSAAKGEMKELPVIGQFKILK